VATTTVAAGLCVLGVVLWAANRDGGTRIRIVSPTTLVVQSDVPLAVDTLTGDVRPLNTARPVYNAVASADGRSWAFACGPNGKTPGDRAYLCVQTDDGDVKSVAGPTDFVRTGVIEDDYWSGETAWSPDSQRVAFLVFERAGNGIYSSGDLYVADLASNAVELVDRGAFARSRNHIHWSPDGRYISMLEGSTLDVRRDLLIVNTLTPTTINASAALTTIGGIEQYAWSPDSRYVTFTRNEGAQSQSLYVATPDGSSLERIADAWGGTQPVWSPDSHWIAASAVDSASYAHVFAVRADGSEQRRLDIGLTRSEAPAWSPDSNRVAFSGAAVGPGSPDIFVADVAKPNDAPTRITTDAAISVFPLVVWAPDGRHIFYTGNAPPCGEGCPPGYLQMVPADGSSAPIQLHDVAVSSILGWLP
jgi:Tol biopolymer transport system component